jgi:GNAT superfamily N-acetyltransferase
MTDTSGQANAPDAAPSNIDDEVRLRAATTSDDDFLLNLFASTRTDELAALAWNPTQAEMFIKMQYRAQQQNYEGNYPAAENQIITLKDQPIGRILVDRGDDQFTLVDIAILPEHRNSGIGGRLLNNLLQEATEASKPVGLYVVNYNPARRLYERLGFAPIADDGMYLEMKWFNLT